jgi:hypothetical protein
LNGLDDVAAWLRQTHPSQSVAESGVLAIDAPMVLVVVLLASNPEEGRPPLTSGGGGGGTRMSCRMHPAAQA